MKKAKIFLSEICHNLPQDYKEEGAQGKLLSQAMCLLSFQNKQPTAFFINSRTIERNWPWLGRESSINT